MTAIEPTDARKLPPVHPGEILREQVLPGLGITAAETAVRTGLTPATIDGLLCETVPVTEEIARALAVLGGGAELWMNLQARADALKPWLMVPIGGGVGWLCPTCQAGHHQEPDEALKLPTEKDDAICEGCERRPAGEQDGRPAVNRRDLPCPKSKHGEHGDPDNSGQCIYCGAILDLMDGETDPPHAG